jgi:hypothetical protein
VHKEDVKHLAFLSGIIPFIIFLFILFLAVKDLIQGDLIVDRIWFPLLICIGVWVGLFLLFILYYAFRVKIQKKSGADVMSDIDKGIDAGISGGF